MQRNLKVISQLQKRKNDIYSAITIAKSKRGREGNDLTPIGVAVRGIELPLP